MFAENQYSISYSMVERSLLAAANAPPQILHNAALTG